MVTLPGEATRVAVRADPGTWIVGVRAGSVAARQLARAHGARRIAGARLAGPARARAGARRRAAGARAARLRRAQPARPARPGAGAGPALAARPCGATSWSATAIPPAVTPDEPADRRRRHDDRRHATARSPARTSPPPAARPSPTSTAPRSPRWPPRRPTASACSASGPARGCSTCRSRTARRSAARTRPAGSRPPIKAGAAVINMSYGSAVAVHRRGAADPARGQGRRGPGRRLRQRVRRGQPARVPGEPAARDHGQRDRARRQADLLLERERRGRPRGAGRRHPHRGAGRVRSRRRTATASPA